LSSAGEIGEHKIIDIIFQNLDRIPETFIPFGDDVSAVEISNGTMAIIKMDMLVGKTDVPPGMTMWQAARKAVVMNVSDLAAKGVKPIAILASIGIPESFPKRSIEDLGRGLNAGAREYGAYIIGGDTNETSDLVISCTAFGISEKRKLILRSGARPGDVLAVTGYFGKSSAGLKILLNKLDAPNEIKSELVNSIYFPRARLNEGLALARSGVVNASIDSSDGLANCLHELRKMSGFGFQITSLPIATEVERFSLIHNINPEELTLYGGEEYELVLSIKSEGWTKALKSVEEVGGELIKIGRVTKEKTILLRTKEKTVHLPLRGWEHFRKGV
jgi:thiamine-monophosphate kinase